MTDPKVKAFIGKATAPAGNTAGDPSALTAVPFSVIPPEPTVPLWLGWILRRHVTLLVAPGGTGKGLLTIDMAARVTRGKPFPGEDSTDRGPEAVILVAPEDDPNEAVAWRLQAAGADLSLVFNLTILPDGSPFVLPESVNDGSVARAIAEIEQTTGRKVGLIVIDPLYACVTKPLTTNAAARRVTLPLEMLARGSGASVVLTHHTVKSGATAGAKGLTDSVRCVLRIERASKDVDTPVRVLSVEKANVMSDTGTMRYVIAGEQEDGSDTCLVWPVEVDQLKAKLSARGYTIDPDMGGKGNPVAYDQHAAVKPDSGEDGQEVHLFLTPGGGNAEPMGTFPSGHDARTFASKHAKHSLTWKAGPIEGSHSAESKQAGKSSWYSILPVN